MASGVIMALGAACTGKTLPYAGGIMLAVQTDLAAPKDVASVGLFITSDGRPIFGDTREVAPNGEVKFPATIAILADADRPGAVVKVRAVAFKASGEVRVLRDVITTIPQGRTGLLRAPLKWINEGSGTGNRDQVVASTDGFVKLVSACPDGQTFLEGECGDAHVDGNSLPDYTEKDVFGGGDAEGRGGRCFDVTTCFASPRDVPLDPSTCSATLPFASPDDPNLSLAIVLPPSADAGECFGGACYIPLDRTSGWSARGGTVELPRGICRKIQDGKALRVVATTACPGKDLTTPACGPASAVGSSTSPPSSDGGTPLDGATAPDFEAPFSAARTEPWLADIAVDDQNVYVSRGKPDMPAAIIRLTKSDLVNLSQTGGFQILHSFTPGVETRAKLALATGPSAARVVARTDSALVLCGPTASGTCPTVAASGPRNAVTAGASATYFFGTPSALETIHSVAHAETVSAAGVALPGTHVTAMHLSGETLLLGTDTGEIRSCAAPCGPSATMTLLRPAPPASASITAIKTTTKVPGTIFFLQVPTGASGPEVGGVYRIGTDGAAEVALATQLGGGGDPPSALAVDARYVYWGATFVDTRDGGAAPKAGVLRLNHVARGPVEAFQEPQPGIDPVTGIAVDDTHVFWTYYRDPPSLFMAKKTGAF